tara:strand:- start:1450 stop:1998 length:549 start_codon:yes stop_codon:yes gene_type:complete
MGYKINADLETSSGPTSELYIRIENWKINRSTNIVTFTTTSWLNSNYAKKFNRKYADEKFRNAVGIVSSKVIYYANERSKGKHFDIKNLYTFEMVKEEEVEIPIMEKKKVAVEVPYISFDENGDEVTLYRTVEEEKQVKVGVKKELKKVIDYSIIDNLTIYSYGILKDELSKLFPKSKILNG